MEYQSNNAIPLVPIVPLVGRVEWTPTQPEAIGNILSLYNDMRYTNGIPMD